VGGLGFKYAVYIPKIPFIYDTKEGPFFENMIQYGIFGNPVSVNLGTGERVNVLQPDGSYASGIIKDIKTYDSEDNTKTPAEYEIVYDKKSKKPEGFVFEEHVVRSMLTPLSKSKKMDEWFNNVVYGNIVMENMLLGATKFPETGIIDEKADSEGAEEKKKQKEEKEKERKNRLPKYRKILYVS
jgi:hypothetical protein